MTINFYSRFWSVEYSAINKFDFDFDLHIFSKTNLIRSHSGCKFFMPDKNDRWRVLRPLKETRIVENVHVSNNIE